MQVKEWRPAPGCPQCKRAEQLFYEHARMAGASHARALKKVKEQVAEIERLRSALSEAADELDHFYRAEYLGADAYPSIRRKLDHAMSANPARNALVGAPK